MVPAQVPDAPESLRGYAREEWHRLTPELPRLGLRTVVDMQTFASYCDAYDRWRTPEEALAKVAESDPINSGLVITKQTGDVVINPLVTAARKAAGVMLRYAVKLGFTPAARSRMRIPRKTRARNHAPEKRVGGNAEVESKFGSLLRG